MNIFFILLTFLVSVSIASVLIPRILLISAKKRLFDLPDARKVHTKAVPRLGGVSFFPTILFAFCVIFAGRLIYGYELPLLYTNYLLPELLLLVCGLTLLYLVGIADDLVGVRYHQKFLIQLFCACLFPLAGLWINDLYGLFGIYSLPSWIGMPFTVIIVVFITNAINLIDGIDGLASGLSGVALLILGTLFCAKEMWTYAMIVFGTFGVLVPFFYYNVFGRVDRSRKIFMGDTGSLTLGYILSFLSIKYSQHNPDVTPYTTDAFMIAFSALILPSFDVIRVVLVRMRKGKSPFEPDKNHIHHKFLAMGVSPRRSMIYLLLLATLFSVVNIALVPYVNDTLLLLIDIAVWIGLNLWWNRVRDKKLLLKR